jgi:hypothetical protein
MELQMEKKCDAYFPPVQKKRSPELIHVEILKMATTRELGKNEYNPLRLYIFSRYALPSESCIYVRNKKI